MTLETLAGYIKSCGTFLVIFIIVIIIINYLGKRKPDGNIAKLSNVFTEAGIKLFASSNLKRFLAVVFIGFLMYTDYQAVMQMLWTLEATEAYIDKSVVAFFGLALAFLLEGLPAFSGGCLSSVMDSSNDKKNDYYNALIGMIVSLLASIAVLWLVFVLRGEYNAQKFDNETPIVVRTLYNFLQYSPILTSIFSFVISWRWLRIDQIELDRLKVENLRNIYQNRDGEYQVALKKYTNSRVKLWTLLTSNDNMPQEMEKYNYETYRMIRSKLLDECMTHYESQVNYFNSRIESELGSFTAKMAEHSNMKDEIIGIRVSDVLQKHDENQATNILCWDSDRAYTEYENYIVKMLDKKIPKYQSAVDINDYPELY